MFVDFLLLHFNLDLDPIKTTSTLINKKLGIIDNSISSTFPEIAIVHIIESKEQLHFQSIAMVIDNTDAIILATQSS